jgi:hypothetical protein
MSAPAPTVERAECAQQTGDLHDLLARLKESLNALRSSEADEEQLHVDLEALPDEVDTFGADFKEQVTACLEIRKQVSSPATRKRFFAGLEKDPAAAATAKANVREAKDKLKAAEAVVDTLFKLTSARDVFDLVEGKDTRKVIAKSLTRVTVSVGKLSQGIEELATNLVFFESNDVQGRLQALPAAPAQATAEAQAADGASVQDEVAATPAAPRAAKAKPSKRSGAARRTAEAKPSKPSRAVPRTAKARAAGTTRDSGTVVRKKEAREPRENTALRAQVEAERTRKHQALSSREFRRIQAILNRRSRWHPFIPSSIGNAVGILKTEEEAAVRVRIEACWSREGQTKTASSGGAAPDRTQPRTRFEAVEYVGGFPADLLVAAEGEPLLTTSFTAQDSSPGGPVSACVKAASEWVSTTYLQTMVEPFCSRQPVKEDDEGNAISYPRLERLNLELFKIPILHLRCGFKDPGHPNADREFAVWMYGEEHRVFWESIPKRWTWKANAWLAGFALLGVPFGLLLGKIL